MSENTNKKTTFPRTIKYSLCLLLPCLTLMHINSYKNISMLNDAKEIVNERVLSIDEDYFNVWETCYNVQEAEPIGNNAVRFMQREKAALGIIDDATFVRTATADSSQLFNYNQGTLMIPSAGIKVHLNRDDGQANIDAMNAGILSYGAGHIGPGSGTAMIGAHNNYGPFGRLGRAGVGSKIYIDTGYAQFIYQISEIHYGNYGDGTTEGFTVDNGQTFGGVANSGSNRIALFTCYPFSAAVTNDRYLVFANLIKGTEMK